MAFEKKPTAFRIRLPFDLSFPVEWEHMWFCNLFKTLSSYCVFDFNHLCYCRCKHTVHSQARENFTCILYEVHTRKQPRLVSCDCLRNPLFGQWIWKSQALCSVVFVHVGGLPRHYSIMRGRVSKLSWLTSPSHYSSGSWVSKYRVIYFIMSVVPTVMKNTFGIFLSTRNNRLLSELILVNILHSISRERLWGYVCNQVLELRMEKSDQFSVNPETLLRLMLRLWLTSTL